ncbi:MAG: TonB-dependent receptor [Candidatus Binatia bacterium]
MGERGAGKLRLNVAAVFLRAQRLVLVVVVVALTAGRAALAEDSPDDLRDSPVHAEAQASRVIEEIIGSARKRDESLQDGPVAVSGISAEQLSRYNVSDLSKVAQMTPQLFVAESVSGNGGSLSMRGIGTSSTSAGFDQAVSIYVDGLQYDRGFVLSQGYFDLARVEVMKGPQALFFGKNSTAGVISLVSADPGDELELIGRVGHEFYADESWYEAIASGPITESFGARLALRYSVLDGYVENVAVPTIDIGSFQPVPAPRHRDWPGKEEFLGRLTLAYQVTPAFDLKLKVGGALLNSDGSSVGLETFSCALATALIDLGENCEPDWKVRQTDLPPAVAASEPLFNREKGRLFMNYRGYNLALTANYDFGDGLPQLTSVSGYSYYRSAYLADDDFTNTSLFFGGEDVSSESFSEELRLLTRFDFPANFMIGGYVQKTDFAILQNLLRALPAPVDPFTGRYVTWDKHSPTDGQTASVFGQLIWNVTETLEFAPGVRYSHVSKDSFSVHDYIHPVFLPLWRPVGNRLVGNFSDDDVSPEIPLTWRPELWEGVTTTLYAAYKRGFKAGGFSNSVVMRTETTVDDALFESEKASGFEGGIKSTWFDRALLFNIVGYRYEFTDLQINFFDSSGLDFIVKNAARATTTGAEANLQWLTPVDGLDLHGSASYNVGRYDDFLSFCYSGQTISQGCTLDANGEPAPLGAARYQDLSGTPLPLAPPWTGAIGFFYQRPLVAGVSASLGADTSYTDNYLLSAIGRSDVHQHHFFRTDASLRLFRDDGLLELNVFGRNLSNEYSISIASVDSPLTGLGTGLPVGIVADQVGSVSRPREVGIELTARF